MLPRRLETHTVPPPADAVGYAPGIGATDPDSIRVVLDHRADRPVARLTPAGRPHPAGVRVAPTDVSAYRARLADGGTP